jgi:hypothetical protein
LVQHVNLVKLCVGIDSVEALEKRQKRAGNTPPAHVTRMWPRREAEILAGGSLYWVMKGLIQARQKVIGLEERVGSDGVRRCALLLEPRIVRVEPAPRRPFQGWRYLTLDQTPRDLPERRPEEGALPASLLAALADIGVR